MTHWTERLFKEQSGEYVEFFEERFDAADAQVEAVLDLVAAEYEADPDSVLDLACGAGRHVVSFADQGLDAEGLDFSEPFLERAREYARERGVSEQAAFREYDLRDLGEWSGSYDLVTSFWNSLGYYDRETDERTLANARRLLGEEGVLVVEASNRDFYLANLESSSVGESDGRLSVERREYDAETGRFRTQLDTFDATDDGYAHDYHMEWENRIYAPVVLRELCEDVGFEDVRLFGDFDGNAVSVDSNTVVVLAQ